MNLLRQLLAVAVAVQLCGTDEVLDVNSASDDKIAETNSTGNLTHTENLDSEVPISLNNSVNNEGEALFGNNTTEIPSENQINNKSNENFHVKSKYNCMKKNYSEETVANVKLLNVSELTSILNTSSNETNSTENYCVLVLFYAKWCYFSAALAPHYNALGRLFPNFDILAIDASHHNSLNARYGVVGVPTVLLFSNKRPVAKVNDTESNVHDLAAFVKQYTGIDAVGHIDVTDQDFNGPLPCIAVQQTNYILCIAWMFLFCCFVYGFSKSSLCHWIIESIQVNWQEAEAQHEHAD